MKHDLNYSLSFWIRVTNDVINMDVTPPSDNIPLIAEQTKENKTVSAITIFVENTVIEGVGYSFR